MSDDAFNEVDDFLAANHRIGLQEVLSNGCFTGQLPVVLADVAKLEARQTERQMDEGDRGMVVSYRGTLTLRGIAYHFRCSVFVDRGGPRFLSDVAEFAPVAAAGEAPPPRRFVRN